MINIWWQGLNTQMMHFRCSGGQQHVILVTEGEVGADGDWLPDVRAGGRHLPDAKQHGSAGPPGLHCDPVLQAHQDPKLRNGKNKKWLWNFGPRN